MVSDERCQGDVDWLIEAGWLLKSDFPLELQRLSVANCNAVRLVVQVTEVAETGLCYGVASLLCVTGIQDYRESFLGGPGAETCDS